VSTSWESLQTALEVFLGGEALRSPEILVVRGRGTARRFCPTIRQAVEQPPETPPSLVLAHLDEAVTGGLPALLRQLAELGSGRLVLVLPDDPTLLPLAEVLRASESASLALRAIDQRRVASAASG